MTRPIAVLRPEPGNAATAERVKAAGLHAIRLPLFEVRSLAWAPPDPARFDALILTSANAARLAGPELDALRDLPIHAIGTATAAAARARGLKVASVGTGNGAELVGALPAQGVERALLLAGHDRALDAGGVIADVIAVYASDPVPVAPAALAELSGAVALLHSARAAWRLGALIDNRGIDRTTIRIAAISSAVADAAGSRWGGVAAAESLDDAALVALARTLAD